MSRPRLKRAGLRREVRRLALELGEALLGVLDRHGLWDGEPSGERDARPRPTAHQAELGDSRRVRRSVELLGALGERLVAALRHEPVPVAISALADRLGTSPREIAHPLVLLVSRGTVVKSGTRRGTRYALAAPRAKRAKRANRAKRPPRRVRGARRPKRPRTPSR